MFYQNTIIVCYLVTNSDRWSLKNSAFSFKMLQMFEFTLSVKVSLTLTKCTAHKSHIVYCHRQCAVHNHTQKKSPPVLVCNFPNLRKKTKGSKYRRKCSPLYLSGFNVRRRKPWLLEQRPRASRVVFVNLLCRSFTKRKDCREWRKVPEWALYCFHTRVVGQN